MKDLGEAAYILGIKIYRDRSRRLIGLSQSTYLDKGLKTFLVQFSLMDPVGLGSPHYAACLILVLGEFLPSKVGEEWFCPRGDDGHYYVG